MSARPAGARGGGGAQADAALSVVRSTLAALAAPDSIITAGLAVAKADLEAHLARFEQDGAEEEEACGELITL